MYTQNHTHTHTHTHISWPKTWLIGGSCPPLITLQNRGESNPSFIPGGDCCQYIFWDMVTTCPKAMLQSLFLQQLVGNPRGLWLHGKGLTLRAVLRLSWNALNQWHVWHVPFGAFSFCRSCCDSKLPPSLAKLPVAATDEPCNVATWHESFGPFLNYIMALQGELKRQLLLRFEVSPRKPVIAMGPGPVEAVSQADQQFVTQVQLLGWGYPKIGRKCCSIWNNSNYLIR